MSLVRGTVKNNLPPDLRFGLFCMYCDRKSDKYEGWRPRTHLKVISINLKIIRESTGNQWSFFSSGADDSILLHLKTILTTQFCNVCNFLQSLAEMPYSNEFA